MSQPIDPSDSFDSSNGDHSDANGSETRASANVNGSGGDRSSASASTPLTAPQPARKPARKPAPPPPTESTLKKTWAQVQQIATAISAVVQLIAQRGWELWRQALLPKVRSRLPSSVQGWGARLLSGALATLLLLLLWLGFSVWGSLSSSSTSIVSTPPSSPTPAPSPQIPDTLTIPPAAPASDSTSDPASDDAIPTPRLELTPEQQLIASIQDQVADVTRTYRDQLVTSIQANFRRSLLSVKVSADWYSLSPTQQDQLASEMLRRSKTLEFSKLELIDEAGQLLARSPVVGTDIVILHR